MRHACFLVNTAWELQELLRQNPRVVGSKPSSLNSLRRTRAFSYTIVVSPQNSRPVSRWLALLHVSGARYALIAGTENATSVAVSACENKLVAICAYLCRPNSSPATAKESRRKLIIQLKSPGKLVQVPEALHCDNCASD